MNSMPARSELADDASRPIIFYEKADLFAGTASRFYRLGH
jgi:hypothetical protein